ncbi:MAG: hypothetical protein ACKVQA_23480 [Burkholderiales bacterium]
MSNDETDDLKPEYPPEVIHGGVRGKYTEHYRQGTNIVVIDPDLSGQFPNTKAVNDALRDYLSLRRAANRNP